MPAEQTHARQQIRAAVERALQELPAIGINVFPGRAYDLGESEIPGVVVTTAARDGEREAIDEDGGSIGAGVTLARVLPVSVIGFAAGEGLEDQLDAIALQVELAIDAAIADEASALMQLVNDVRLDVTQVIINGQGSPRQGQIRLSYEIRYFTFRGSPQTATK
jgi:hypothetical protein